MIINKIYSDQTIVNPTSKCKFIASFRRKHSFGVLIFCKFDLKLALSFVKR